MRILLAGVSLALVASVTQAESYAELARATVNPDYKPYPNGTGVVAQARFELPADFFAFARFNETGFRPSGPVVGKFKEGEDWTILESGYQLTRFAGFDLEVGASYQAVWLDDQREDGYGIHANIATMPWSWLKFSLDLAYVDLVLQDIALTADLALMVTEQFGVTLRLHDHSDWDFTSYEAGLRYYF